MKKFLLNLFFALLCTGLGLLFVISPVVLIRGGTQGLFVHYQETALYLLTAIASFVAAFAGFRLTAGIKELKRQRLIVWLFLAAGYLYIACAVLCVRINFGALESETFRNAGLVILLIGSAIRLKAIVSLGRFHSGYVALQKDHVLVQKGLYKYLRHPSYLGALIAMIGVPMCFGAWFPLLAAPGFFVMLKWRMNDEEAFLVGEFGDEYKAYQEETWRLIPFVY